MKMRAEFSWGSPLMAVRFLGLPAFSFTLKVLDGSHERAMLAWANSWISDRLDRMSKQGDSPNYECGSSCGSAKGAQQLTFMYSCAAIRRHVRFTGDLL